MGNRTLTPYIHEDSGRIFGLDLLRAFAIVQVVLAHGTYDIKEIIPVKWATLVLVSEGVTTFFVLSGFLIGRILIQTISSSNNNFNSLRIFWLRRWFRTLPNYFLVLSFLFIYQYATTGHLVDGWWRYVLFIQNFAMEHPPFFPEAWSLSIEEWFYISTPVIFLAIVSIGISKQRAWLSLIVSVAVLSICLRYLYYLQLEPGNLSWWDLNIRKNIVSRLDSLIYGVLGAYILFYHKSLWYRYKIPCLILGVAILLLYRWWTFSPVDVLKNYPLYYSVFSFNILTIATLLTLPYLSQWRVNGGRICKWITLISVSSYSMYLLHFSVIRQIIIPRIIAILPQTTETIEYIIIYSLYWILTICLSIILYRVFEKPVTQLRSKFT